MLFSRNVTYLLLVGVLKCSSERCGADWLLRAVHYGDDVL